MLELWGCRVCSVVCKDLTFSQDLRIYECITHMLNLSMEFTANVVLNMRHESCWSVDQSCWRQHPDATHSQATKLMQGPDVAGLNVDNRAGNSGLEV